MTYSHVAIDIETVGIESTSGMLSIAVLPFNLNETRTVEQLKEETLFIKFDIKDQIKRLNRTIDQDTIVWWKQQSKQVKQISYLPDVNRDVTIEKGWQKIIDFLNKKMENLLDTSFWSRGSFDQSIIDSFQNNCNVQPIVQYWQWNDFRTALRILYNADKFEILKLSDKDRHDISLLNKHDPTCDVITDVICLTRTLS